jgi:hypothetical protein
MSSVALDGEIVKLTFWLSFTHAKWHPPPAGGWMSYKTIPDVVMRTLTNIVRIGYSQLLPDNGGSTHPETSVYFNETIRLYIPQSCLLHTNESRNPVPTLRINNLTFHVKYRSIYSSWPLACGCAVGLGDFTLRYCFTKGCCELCCSCGHARL